MSLEERVEWQVEEFELPDFDKSPQETRVLLIDDDEGMRFLCEQLLKKEGYAVDTAGCVDEGKEKFRKSDYDAVISDNDMPGGEKGIDLLREIKDDRKYRFTTCILMTGGKSEYLIMESLRARLDDFLPKPFESNGQFVEAVKRAVNYQQRLKYEYNVLFRKAETLEIDAVTGIACRAAGMPKVEASFARAIEEGKHYSVIIVDLDDFKSINDTYGHLKGDEAMRAVGEILREHVKRFTDDTLRIDGHMEDMGGLEVKYFGDMFKYGGDEMLIGLAETDERGACIVAERIRAGIKNYKELRSKEGNPVRLSASIGVAQVAKGEGLKELIEHADAASYAAKRSGKNKVVAYSSVKPVPGN
ncbi:diguanylate cyclase [Candidatus Woesearchaeota archaeon]|nr:diguanylate cyclase [Candidatus Woesearchaeota archaeon]